VQAAASTQFPDNVAKAEEMVALNPFVPGPSVCIVAKKTVGKGIHICELKSIFTHNNACPVVRGKITSKMLMKDKSFVATVAKFGGRASEKVMRAEASKIGFGGDAASEGVFWRVNAMIRHTGNSCWEEKWEKCLCT
jgi:hypothetical protein